MKGFVTFRRTVLLLATLAYAPPTFAQIDPLPSWNDGASKQPIVSFVKATTTPGSPTFVAISERIATFDQDGTLWVSHPMCAQVVFCLDRVPALVKAKPELAMKEPFKTVMSGNRDAIATLSNADLEKILMATLTGMSVDDFTADAKKWIADARPAMEKAVYRAQYGPAKGPPGYEGRRVPAGTLRRGGKAGLGRHQHKG
jgi:hypothetical protein